MLTSPKPGWIPLREAPFLYRATRSSDGDFLDGTSLDDLETTLTELSGASEADIDAHTQTFKFLFIEPVTTYWGEPWVILTPAETYEASPEAGIDPEMIFDKNYKYMDDEEQRFEKRRYDKIVLATGVVWRQTMVREFDIAVEAGLIRLHARSTVNAPFQPIPPDAWPSYRSDWATGYAVGLDFSTLLSIHVAPIPSGKRGRVPVYDYETVRGEVYRLLKSRGIPNLTNDPGWQTRSDLNHVVEGFCERVFGRRPSRSTLDPIVTRAMAEWSSRAPARARKKE